jgi:ComF family protein
MPPYCEHCGRPLRLNTCPYCQSHPLQIDGMRAVAVFEGNLRRVIHAFKYEHRPELAPVLASLMTDYLTASPMPVDAVIPVPLHPSRERERGYNQSALLAHALAQQTQVPVLAHALTRTRITRSQVELNAQARHANVRNAFAADACMNGARVLLIDDVCTTGATMDACGIALKERGAKSVWGLAVARTR